jgi:hypothetical protein
VTAPLADPISCPGLVDLLAVIASRTWRDVPLGSMMAAGNAVMLAVALLLLARVVRTITSSIIITTAITLAAAASTVFAFALTPSPAAAFVTTIAAWTAILRARREGQSIARARLALGLLALLAATVVPFMVPAAILAGWLGWRFGKVHAALGPVAVLAPAAVAQVALPQGPSTTALSYVQSCVMPHVGITALMDAGRSFGSVIASNPVVTALVVLGLLSLKRLPRDAARSLLPLTAIAFWGLLIVPGPTAWTLTPFVLAFWILAATGLAEVWRALGPTAGGRAGAVALSALLVVLQLVSTHAPRSLDLARDGHDRLSLSMMGAVVGALPRGAGLVEEDAVTDLLTRALPSRVRASDRFHRVTRQPNAITEALGNSRVFALPRSQRVLQYAGFEMIDAVPGVPGLAEIRQAHPCTAGLHGAPASLEPILGQRRFGLVAADERSRDRAVIVFASDVPLSAAPVDWPPDSRRNIQGRVFDLTVAADRTDFSDEITKYQLSSWSRPETRYVTRIEIWRPSGSPLVLPIALGDVAKAGTARVLDSSPGQRLTLCPAFPYEVRPLFRRP